MLVGDYITVLGRCRRGRSSCLGFGDGNSDLLIPFIAINYRYLSSSINDGEGDWDISERLREELL